MQQPHQRPLTITRHPGLAGLLQLDAAWRQLARNHGRHFLHHPTWFQAQLQALEQGPENVLFLAVHQNQQLVAVIPLKRVRKSLRERFRVPLHYWAWELYYPNEMGLCDVCLDPGAAGADLIQALLQALRAEPGWDVLELLHLPQDSAFLQAIHATRRLFSKPSHSSKYLDCRDGYEQCMARFSNKFRRNLRRKLNNLGQLGNYRFDYVTTRDQLETAFQHFLGVEAAGWKGEGGTSILQQPARFHYYQQLLQGFGDSGQLAIHLLWLGDRCIGGQFLVETGSNLELLKIGYDQDFASVSPGFLLVDHLLQLACQRPEIERISFVTGTDWMEVWKPEQEAIGNSYYFNRTPKGMLLSLAMRGFEWIKSYRNRGIL